MRGRLALRLLVAGACALRCDCLSLEGLLARCDLCTWCVDPTEDTLLWLPCKDQKVVRRASVVIGRGAKRLCA